MRRTMSLLAVLPLVLALAACSPQAQEQIKSGLQTAAPTWKAVAGTEVSSAMQTAGPTIQAAAASAGTQVVAAIGTAGPTIEAAAASAGTQVAAAVGTAQPTIEAAAGALAFAPVMMGTWAWQDTVPTTGTGQTPSDPASYTLKFGTEGKVAIKADCNTASGTYTVKGDALSITVGSMTQMACPEGSLGDVFVQQLGEVDTWAVESGKLVLTLKMDGGNMEFTQAK